MPTRVITGGVGPIPGDSMLERKLHFERHMDGLRLLLMREPRGHGAMSGAILQPPLRDDADWGVVFIEVSGCLPMCGHGTIGVATVLVETGMVEVREPETVVRLDTPAGLVEARVAVEGGRARSVALRNVPSFLLGRDRQVEVEGRVLTYDMAFGGNFYAILPAESAGLAVDPARADELIERGLAVMAAINAADRPVHPGGRAHRGLQARGLHGARQDGPRSQRSATSIHPGWLDRSPCGTGTSAKLAALHARGELGVGDEFVNRVGDRHALRRPDRGGDRGRRPARGGAGDHGPGLDHRDGAVRARSRGSVPGGIRALSGDRGGRRRAIPSTSWWSGPGSSAAPRAWELARRGVSVCLVDRAAELAAGTTGLGEGNVLCCDKAPGPELELAMAGLALYDEIEELLGERGGHPAQGRAGGARRAGRLGGRAGAPGRPAGGGRGVRR